MEFISRTYPNLPTMDFSQYEFGDNEIFIKVYDKFKQLVKSGNPMPRYLEFAKIIYNEIDKKTAEIFISWYSYSDWIITHTKDIYHELKEIREFFESEPLYFVGCECDDIDPYRAITKFYAKTKTY